MGNICSCCSKRERSVEDILDGSLEDKLLGKREDDLEATTAEEEAWRQRRQQVKDEEDLSMKSLGDDDAPQSESRGQALVWDLSDRSTVLTVQKEATDLDEDEEDEEAFGSAKEDSNDDDDQETKKQVDNDGEINLDSLTQLSARSVDDSYASMPNSYREDARVFRGTELDNATEVSDTVIAPSSLRGADANTSFLVDDEDEGHEQEQQQKEEHDDDQTEEDNGTEKHHSTGNSNSSRKRSSKKKSRSKKSSRK